MSGTGRGPTGIARLPPAWLPGSPLSSQEVPAGSPFARIHHSHRSPVFFSPGEGQPPVGRFDSATGRFGVLYLAFDFAGAFAETVLRNPARRFVSSGEIAGRSLAVLTLSRAVRLVWMHGAGLQALGVDNAVTTGPYEPCGIWADALFAHADAPDGIAYASRHDPEQVCVALFSRPDIAVTVVRESVPLTAMVGAVAAVLRRYGKGLDR
jgi:RES domain-containing protein